MSDTKKKYYLTAVLLILFILSSIHIISSILEFSDDSLQMDFTAYYTAGKVLNHGFDPYKNQITDHWNLWDGVSVYKHSRFLYPPLVGNIFQPLALVKYSTAKYIWNFLNFGCIILASLVFFRAFKIKKTLNNYLIAGILIFTFFPLLTLLERGQIDGVTFLMIAIAIDLMRKKEKPKSFFAGLLWALATLFKLYSLVIIPFLILRKRWNVLAGYATGIILLVILMVSISGADLVRQYFFDELPRISEYGESGTEDMKIESEILRAYFPMTPTSVSIIENKFYITESISFNSKATFLRIFIVFKDGLGLTFSNSIISGILLLLLITVIYYVLKKYPPGGQLYDLIYWQTAIVIILLTSTFTWVMNLVWLIPLIMILMVLYPEYKARRSPAFPIIFAGFLLSWMPDNLLLVKNITFIGSFFKVKYILSEAIIFIGLLYALKNESKSALTKSVSRIP